MYNLPRIRVVYPDCSHAVFPLNQAAINCKGSNGTRHVAAIARVIDIQILHSNRREGVINVSIWMRWPSYDTNFGEARYAAAQAVELSAIGIGGANCSAEDR